MKIRYDTYQNFEGWNRAPQAIEFLIRHYGVKNVLEIGAGANPTLDIEAVERLKLNYTANDVDADELAKAPSAYQTLACDLTNPEIPPEFSGRYQFIFSRMVNEHVRDGEVYFRNICKLLEEGGITVHFFSTLYSLPFLMNKALPEFLSARLLDRFRPRDGVKHGKFKAYYSWSRGPTFSAVRRFRRTGFEVIEYAGYFGHSYYRDKLPSLHRLEECFAKILAEHPIALCTSYAKLVMRKASGN